MPEPIIRLLGLVTGIHGLARYAHWKEVFSAYPPFLGDDNDKLTFEPPTYLDVWVLLPDRGIDWQNLVWVLCGIVLIRFSKQIARMLPQSIA